PGHPTGGAGAAGSAAHGSHGGAHVAHHFESAQQQKEAVTLGMWAFLLNEVLFFGGLFLLYTMYRAQFYDAFVAASHHLAPKLGGFNTAVLIGSSLTVVLSVWSAQTGRKKAISFWLVLTILLGLVFLGIKSIEYTHKWHEHLIPGPHFLFSEGHAGHAQIFFALYFMMTGMHALHMIIGIGIFLWLLRKSIKGQFD